jgi:hypothetical protein
MRHAKHPELGGLLPLDGLLGRWWENQPPANFGYCLDCGRFWGNMSLDGLYDDVGWHQISYPAHVVHVWSQ